MSLTSIMSSIGQNSDKEYKLSLNEDHFSNDNKQTQTSEELSLSTESQIESAIAKYIKVLRTQTDEEVKRRLVHKICELRIKLNELNDLMEQSYVCGHKLIKCIESKSGSLVCDHCLKKQKISLKIFPSKKSENCLLICQFCEFIIHQKCKNNQLIRKCPKVLFEESTLNFAQIHNTRNVILKICPEIGLSNQQFRCAECKVAITLPNSRICDYSGFYYCNNCHWGESDSVVIPARLIHNWDFIPRPVSRCSLQIINYIRLKPVLFNITELNSMLYGLVDELAQIKRVRSELSQMSKYIRLCKQPIKPKISLNNYLVDERALNSYSLTDLSNLPQLFKSLTEAHNKFMDHIINNCEGCRGKGFFCELCRDKEDLLFPFSPNIANCLNCSAVYHKNCYYRRNKMCPRCQRLKEKRQQLNDTNSNSEALLSD